MDKTIDKLNIGSKLDPIDERSYDESKEDYGNDPYISANGPSLDDAPANSQNDESMDSIVNNVNHQVGSMSSHSQ